MQWEESRDGNWNLVDDNLHPYYFASVTPWEDHGNDNLSGIRKTPLLEGETYKEFPIVYCIGVLNRDKGLKCYTTLQEAQEAAIKSLVESASGILNGVELLKAKENAKGECEMKERIQITVIVRGGNVQDVNIPEDLQDKVEVVVQDYDNQNEEHEFSEEIWTEHNDSD